MEKLSFVEGSEKDLPLLTDLLSEGSRRKQSHGDTVWDDNWTIAEVEEYFKNSTPYIVRKGNEIIGTVWLQYEDKIWGDLAPDAGYLHRLVIKEEFAGQELGMEVIDWAAQQVKAAGRDFLRLDCPTDNQGLRKYYEDLGFQRIEDKFIPEYGYSETLYERGL